MKGNIEHLTSYQDAVKKIGEKDAGCWLIEDWNRGLLVGEGELKDGINKIEQAYNDYSQSFRFRVFTQSYELLWDGQGGLFLSEQEGGEYEVTSSTVLLDEDTTAFPGLQQIRGKKKIQTHIYLQGGQKVFQRFVKFL